ncbi:SsrA-binding protein SmpB [Candidatus Dependentiae bacterium]|nr:SsrA-binding protein SmpB [Candidatus Dependentiae bacterium]
MKVISSNKKAYFNYEINDTFEAGIVLTGDEIKSIRANSINLSDAFAVVQRGELQLINCYIAPYRNAYSKADFSRRTRTLLMHKREITKLIGEIARKGLTLIPTKAYFNARGYIKVELGLAKHKKMGDKKETLKERDIKRETLRDIKVRLK